jgi:HAD superfamily hydrolase (TIGR01509 family)
LDPPGASLSEEELTAASDKLELLIAENGRLIQQAGGRGITALPGAIAFLQRLSMLGANFGIVTSATKGYATSALETSGVTEAVKIPFVVTAGDCVHGKPHPEPYLRGVERLKEVAGGEVNAEDVLVFEDAPSGITSGLKAGCRTLAVCTSHSRERIEGLESTYKVVDLERVEVVSVEKGHITLRLKELHEE